MVVPTPVAEFELVTGDEAFCVLMRMSLPFMADELVELKVKSVAAASDESATLEKAAIVPT